MSPAKGELFDRIALGRIGRSLEKLVMRRNVGLEYEYARVLTLAFSYARSEQVEGDYAEFGVWKGDSFVDAYQASQRAGGQKRTLHAFDSFEGLPEVGGTDVLGRFTTGEFSSGRATFDQTLARARVPSDRVKVVEGFYDRSLTTPEAQAVGSIAIAWVDCDLYASTVPVLDYLTPRLAQGAVLLFDDWFCFKGARDLGEARACAEWLERNPEISLVEWHKFSWAGQAFLVRRPEVNAVTS